MIKIRYSDLPAGLHIRAVAEGRHTILYLLPGLTAAERRSAIARARSGARVGYGPPLPAAEMAAALIADRVRATLSNGFAALRVNPAYFVPAVIAVTCVAVAYLLLASVTLEFSEPQNAGPGPQRGDLIGVAPGSSHATSPAGGSQPGSDPAASRQPAGARRGDGLEHGKAASNGPHPDPTSSAQPGLSSSGSRQPKPPDPPPGKPPGHSPGPALSPSSSPSPAPAAAGLCLEVGSLGVCLE